MSLELECWDDDEEDDWCNDVWNIGLPPSKEYLQTRSRTLTQIVSFNNPGSDTVVASRTKLQVKLILRNTELDPETWVRIYAEKFRAIMDEDPSLTEFQIKYLLYYAHYVQ